MTGPGHVIVGRRGVLTEAWSGRTRAAESGVCRRLSRLLPPGLGQNTFLFKISRTEIYNGSVLSGLTSIIGYNSTCFVTFSCH